MQIYFKNFLWRLCTSLESLFVSPSKGMIRILQSGLWFLWKSQISAILSAGECPLGNYTDKGSLHWLTLRTPSQWRGWVTFWELDVLCMLAILRSCCVLLSQVLSCSSKRMVYLHEVPFYMCHFKQAVRAVLSPHLSSLLLYGCCEAS